MAALQKVERFDSEGLENLKKSLICDTCKKPPRPKTLLYECMDGDCGNVRCDICVKISEDCHDVEMSN